jgi:Holliday junction resolvase RusA-like endonuclease
VHWRTLAKAKADYKYDCFWMVHSQIVVRLVPPTQAQVTFVVTDRRRRDTDNHIVMLKPAFDALVQAGVLEDDSHDKLKIAEPKWERGPEKKVIVELVQYKDIS